MEGNLGRGVMKVSAVAVEHQIVEAPAVVFQDQQDLADAFKAGLLEKDFVAVMRFQGPRSNGMPELHNDRSSRLQDRGQVSSRADGVVGCSSGIPLERGPWKRITADEILLQQAGLERVGQVLLVLEHHRRGFDDLVFHCHGGNFHSRHARGLPSITRRPPSGEKARATGRRMFFIEAFDRAVAPDQFRRSAGTAPGCSG